MPDTARVSVVVTPVTRKLSIVVPPLNDEMPIISKVVFGIVLPIPTLELISSYTKVEAPSTNPVLL